MSRKASRKEPEKPVVELIASLTREQLAGVVVDAADRHEDVARAVRLVVARSTGDLVALRNEVDHALRTRRWIKLAAWMIRFRFGPCPIYRPRSSPCDSEQS